MDDNYTRAMPRYMGPMPIKESEPLSLDAAEKHQAINTRIHEIDAMRDLAKILDAMPPDALRRVLTWLVASYQDRG
ncbi:MAG: hypothetical protein WC563_15110 [Brevundimonas sp.]